MARKRKTSATSRRSSGGDSRFEPKLPLCPDPSQPLPAVFLTTPIFHPLIYRKRLVRVDDSARPGDLVAVYHTANDPAGELFGYGFYNPRSEIALRLIRWSPELPDSAFWQHLVDQAVQLRHEILALPECTSAYRLVHSEADGFPGLVVDRYDDVLSAEVFSLAMYQRVSQLLPQLQEQCGTRHILIQAEPQFLGREGYFAPPIASAELPKAVVVHEHGTRFRIRFESSHKTGFFCDQRDNRLLLTRYCRDRQVLDLCCYSGGFAVQAKRLGQAAEVTAVDLDEEPLQLARENAALNQVKVRFVRADIFPFMRDLVRLGRQFDVVVLDPPKLIRTRQEIDDGARKHFDMNRLAMQLVRPGGLLLSCSCAGLLSQEAFDKLLAAAARQAQPESDLPSGRRGSPRRMQILARTGAACDHPLSSQCPETEYLKAVWMRID